MRADAASFTWNTDAAGPSDWNNAANWNPNTGFPNAAGDVANLTNDISVDNTIDLEQPITVGTLNIGDSGAGADNSFVIQKGAGAGSLTLNSGSAAAAQVNVTAGLGNSVDINVPVTFVGDVDINVATGTRLSIFPQNAFGAYTGGNNLIKTGGGELYLGRFGVLSYSGELRVKAGFVQGGRLPAGTDITVYANSSYQLTDFSPTVQMIRGGGTVQTNVAGMVIGTGTPNQSIQQNVVTTGGELKPGDTDVTANGVGTLTLNANASGLRFESGSSTFIDITGRSTGNETDPNFDHFDPYSAATLIDGGDLYVRLLGGYQPGAYQTFIIMDAGRRDQGYFEDLNGGTLFDNIIDFDGNPDTYWKARLTNIQDFNSGWRTFGKFTQVELQYVPEPSTGLLFAGVAAGMMLVRRRRRH